MFDRVACLGLIGLLVESWVASLGSLTNKTLRLALLLSAFGMAAFPFVEARQSNVSPVSVGVRTADDALFCPFLCCAGFVADSYGSGGIAGSADCRHD